MSKPVVNPQFYSLLSKWEAIEAYGKTGDKSSAYLEPLPEEPLPRCTSKMRRSISLTDLNKETQVFLRARSTTEMKAKEIQKKSPSSPRKTTKGLKRQFTWFALSKKKTGKEALFSSSPIRPISPRIDPRKVRSAEPKNLMNKLEESAEKCGSALEVLRQLQEAVGLICESGDRSLIFPLSNSLNRQAEEIVDIERKSLAEVHTILCNSSVYSHYSEVCKNEEQTVSEFGGKIIEFIAQMEALLRVLEQNDVELAGYEGEKHEFAEALRDFIGALNPPLLRKQLETLSREIHCDTTAVSRTFEQIKVYFEAVENLSKTYICNFAFCSVTIVNKKGRPARTVFQNRFGKDSERDAVCLFQTIPRELSQYASLVRKWNEDTCQILGLRTAYKLPCSAEKRAIEATDSLHAKLLSAQERMNRLTVFEKEAGPSKIG